MVYWRGEGMRCENLLGNQKILMRVGWGGGVELLVKGILSFHSKFPRKSQRQTRGI